MGAYWSKLRVCACAGALASAGGAWADELVMPYGCGVAGGVVTLTPSSPKSYAVEGHRDEQPFQDCHLDGQGNTSCTSVMVHRFAIACAGGVVPWSRVAQAASDLGAALPRGLPHGYAPITPFKGRIVLPALARFSPHRDSVSSETLRAEGVVFRDRGGSVPQTAGTWSTVVKAEMRPEMPGKALRVAGILAVLLAAFLTLGLAAARRPVAELERGFVGHIRRCAGWFAQALELAFSRLLPEPQSKSGDGEQGLLNAVSIATARLAEAELVVASLPRALALRAVLEGELDGVRGRIAVIAQGLASRPGQKSAGMVRAALRDLDRIGRIARGAVKDSVAEPMSTMAESASSAMPESVQDAYRVLGLNGDAAPAVAKKLVDALRMTWHPDFARNEDDRRMREARMKQINAAWDMIKNRMAEAA